MTKTSIKILCFIFAVVFAFGIYYFWNSLRPDDDWTIQVGAGAVGFLASFISAYFLTKGSGGGD